MKHNLKSDYRMPWTSHSLSLSETTSSHFTILKEQGEGESLFIIVK
jgi:hypothetical protein